MNKLLIPIREAEIIDDEMLGFITGGNISATINCAINDCGSNTAPCDNNDCGQNNEPCKTNKCKLNKVTEDPLPSKP